MTGCQHIRNDRRQLRPGENTTTMTDIEKLVEPRGEFPMERVAFVLREFVGVGIR